MYVAVRNGYCENKVKQTKANTAIVHNGTQYTEEKELPLDCSPADGYIGGGATLFHFTIWHQILQVIKRKIRTKIFGHQQSQDISNNLTKNN
jgi:hypothetical protein